MKNAFEEGIKKEKKSVETVWKRLKEFCLFIVVIVITLINFYFVFDFDVYALVELTFIFWFLLDSFCFFLGMTPLFM